MANPLYEITNPTDLKLTLGELIWTRFLNADLSDLGEVEEIPPGQSTMAYRQSAATSWLEAIGFTNVEWIQPSDYILLCLLTYMDEVQGHPPVTGIMALQDVNFIIEFTGPDASSISVFDMVGHKDI